MTMHTYKVTLVETPSVDTAVEAPSVAEQIIAREKDYVLQNYGRYPLVLSRGRGVWLYDHDG